MLRTCKYCGRVHRAENPCEAKARAEAKRRGRKRNSRANAFRQTNDWTLMSREVRSRDKYLCLCCKANLLGTRRTMNSKDLSVHHIEPLHENFDKRLDRYNLITVCAMHHEMCEKDEISRELQKTLVTTSEKEYETEGRHLISV